MKIIQTAVAGTLESSDCMITIETNEDKGLLIELESSVKRQFGKQILKVVNETLSELDVKDAKIKILDKGALDYCIVARIKAAVHRASDNKDYKF